MPWCVGGPDFANKPRERRCYADAPKVNLDACTAMMSQRCESQSRTDWDFNPGLWSLAFASKINLATTMSITRALRRGGGAKEDEVTIGAAAARIYMLLRQGEYMDAGGNRRPVNGDISKIHQIIGLSNVEKALLTNYHFMSSRFTRTRQIRNSIRHIVFNSRVFYGLPLYGSLTPSERHSGLILRLYRCRQTDLALTTMSKKHQECAAWNFPSLVPPAEDEVVVDLPDYDTRKIISSRDPLCCIHAFQVMTRVVLPALFGLRMCPECPHCACAKKPCMDMFGSNGTPMGGTAGKAMAFVGAVENQKTEGVMHVHFFYIS